ncbi:hypothetical protein ES703_72673 [subsurface metagenome]
MFVVPSGHVPMNIPACVLRLISPSGSPSNEFSFVVILQGKVMPARDTYIFGAVLDKCHQRASTPAVAAMVTVSSGGAFSVIVLPGGLTPCVIHS